MNLKKILEKGYLPKELPPPFESKSFAEKYRYIKAKWQTQIDLEKKQKVGESKNDANKRFKDKYSKYNSSQLAVFSLAKGIYSRRKLGIPNPKQFSDLSNAIIENWSLIRETHKLSIYSESTPVESKAIRAVRTKSISWNKFKFQLIEKSFDKKFELKLDISQFYPTIYTHSIPWAILGREKSKNLFKIALSDRIQWESLLKRSKDAQKYRASDFIDTLVRNCNDRQSIGLCIGPDTSLILAEVIANRIDFEINKRLEKINHTGTRYYDDYYFYFNNRNEAENALKIIQQILYEFQLETNENKVSINKLPFKYIEDWTENFDRFNFEKVDRFELRNFFSLLNNTLENHEKNSSWIIHYALKSFKSGDVAIIKEDWQLFLSFLLQTLIIDSSTIDLIFEIILIYEVYLDNKSKLKIKNVLEEIIKEHLILNHSFEVSWALWILYSFNIKCETSIIEMVFESKDSFSKLICLDIVKKKLYEGKIPKTTTVKKQIETSSSLGENWLLIYETIKQNWINFDVNDETILDNDYFNIMLNYDVSFYNNENQVIPKVIMVYDPFFEEYNLEENLEKEDHGDMSGY